MEDIEEFCLTDKGAALVNLLVGNPYFALPGPEREMGKFLHHLIRYPGTNFWGEEYPLKMEAASRGGYIILSDIPEGTLLERELSELTRGLGN